MNFFFSKRLLSIDYYCVFGCYNFKDDPLYFIVSNNKTYKRYKFIFLDLITKLNSIMSYNKSKLWLNSITIDFEIAFTSFIDLFKTKCQNIKHMDCYYHFLANIEKI